MKSFKVLLATLIVALGYGVLQAADQSQDEKNAVAGMTTFYFGTSQEANDLITEKYEQIAPDDQDSFLRFVNLTLYLRNEVLTKLTFKDSFKVTPAKLAENTSKDNENIKELKELLPVDTSILGGWSKSTLQQIINSLSTLNDQQDFLVRYFMMAVFYVTSVGTVVEEQASDMLNDLKNLFKKYNIDADASFTKSTTLYQSLITISEAQAKKQAKAKEEAENATPDLLLPELTNCATCLAVTAQVLDIK